MAYTVSITSQGQISIPAKLRRKLGLHKKQQAIISERNGELVVKPVVDFLELGGSLHHKAIKNKSIDEIIKLENEAIEEAFVDRYRKHMKKMKIPIPMK